MAYGNINTAFPLVQFITIRVSPPRAMKGPLHKRQQATEQATEDADEFNDNLKKLAVIIKTSTGQLCSFSLAFSRTINVSLANNTTGFTLNADVIEMIIHALPSSCVALELETNDYERQGWNKPHFCPVIQSILPRLRHLSLSLASVCATLHKEPHNTEQKTSIRCPALRTLCLSLSPRAKCLSHINTECDSLISREEALRHYEPTIACTLQPAYADGKFPKASQIDVIHLQSNSNTDYHAIPHELIPESAWENRYPFYTQLLVIRDCLHNSTYPLPLQLVSMRPLANIIYDRGDTCYISPTSSWRDLVEQAGQRTPWGESVTGARVPKEMFGDVIFDVPTLMTRDEYVAWTSKMNRPFIPRGASWRRDRDPGSVKWQRVVELPGVDAEVTKDKLPQTNDTPWSLK
jgi:hypothetical protein